MQRSADNVGFYYHAFGLNIASNLLLPEFGQAEAPIDSPDVIINLAPESISSPAEPAPTLEVEQGEIKLTVATVGCFRIRAGREIVIQSFVGSSERSLRLFLLGSAFGALCRQRGLLTLHANAIVTGGRAVAFCGHAGIGKSTLAAYFQSRGYPVLCDDVCVISFDSDGNPLAWPGLPCLKLRADAARVFGHDCGALEAVMEGLDKYHVPMQGPPPRRSYPLTGVYILSDLEPGSRATISRLGGGQAVQMIMANTYRPEQVEALNLAGGNFLQASLVAKHACVYAAPRRRGFDVFAEEALRFEQHFNVAGA